MRAEHAVIRRAADTAGPGRHCSSNWAGTEGARDFLDSAYAGSDCVCAAASGATRQAPIHSAAIQQALAPAAVRVATAVLRRGGVVRRRTSVPVDFRSSAFSRANANVQSPMVAACPTARPRPRAVTAWSWRITQHLRAFPRAAVARDRLGARHIGRRFAKLRRILRIPEWGIAPRDGNRLRYRRTRPECSGVATPDSCELTPCRASATPSHPRR